MGKRNDLGENETTAGWSTVPGLQSPVSRTDAAKPSCPPGQYSLPRRRVQPLRVATPPPQPKHRRPHSRGCLGLGKYQISSLPYCMYVVLSLLQSRHLFFFHMMTPSTSFLVENHALDLFIKLILASWLDQSLSPRILRAGNLNPWAI